MCLGAKKQREIKTCLKFDGIHVMLLLLPRHDWTSAMKTTRVNEDRGNVESACICVCVCCVLCACACVCTPYTTVHSVPLFLPLSMNSMLFFFTSSFSIECAPLARLLVLRCRWWRRRRQQQRRRRRQWEMMKSQTEVLATQAYNNTTTIINTATQKWYESRIHISYVILVDCSGSVLPSLFLVHTSWSSAVYVKWCLPNAKSTLNVWCVFVCVRAIICVSRRDNVWVHVRRGTEQKKKMKRTEKKEKAAYKRIQRSWWIES